MGDLVNFYVVCVLWASAGIGAAFGLDARMSAPMVDLIKSALVEDVDTGDVSAALLDPAQQLKATLITREACVLCGVAYVNEVLRQVHQELRIDWHYQEGDVVPSEAILAEWSGPGAAILSAERVALNFLQTLSAVATQTRAFVTAVQGTPARIYDTRKTLPGWRYAQKMAVRVGGGYNHRMGLYDAYLIKENHIRALGSIAACVAQARRQHPQLLLQVEVEDLVQLQSALDAEVPLILLDNFTVSQLRDAVRLNQGRAALEASGGVDLAQVRQIAETGVDRIAIGCITKDIQAIDLSLQVQDAPALIKEA
jgi:nicotinate-nucleotide pyrophosphorylase (carboxylating)